MRCVFITPCKDCLLVEMREKSSANLRGIIVRTPWLKWEQRKDVNGKGHLQWYIVVDTMVDKDSRLKEIAKVLCEDEGFTASSRICPHDSYYEDMKFFPGYN